MARGEDILLKARVETGRVGQRAFQQRRCDGIDSQLLLVEDGQSAIEFGVIEVENVPAPEDAQLGGFEPGGTHLDCRDFRVGRKLVGNCADSHRIRSSLR